MRAILLPAAALLLLSACAQAPEPEPAAEAMMEATALEQAQQAETRAEINAARLAVAEALTEARTLRAALLQEAMAEPADSPRRPALADRADRLKQLETDLVASQDALLAARAPATPAEVAQRSVMRAQEATRRLTAMTSRMAR